MIKSSIEKELAVAAARMAESRSVDLLVFNSEVDVEAEYAVLRALGRRRELSPLLFLFLTTDGGTVDSAYRIMRRLQGQYEAIMAVVAGSCKGAGTLMCLGSDELHMGSLGELGPLAGHARETTVSLVRAYANRLNAESDILNRGVIDDALDQLLFGYPSKEFVIERREASTLYNRFFILDDDDDLCQIVRLIGVDATLPRTRRSNNKRRVEYLNDLPSLRRIGRPSERIYGTSVESQLMIVLPEDSL